MNLSPKIGFEEKKNLFLGPMMATVLIARPSQEDDVLGNLLNLFCIENGGNCVFPAGPEPINYNYMLPSFRPNLGETAINLIGRTRCT